MLFSPPPSTPPSSWSSASSATVLTVSASDRAESPCVDSALLTAVTAGIMRDDETLAALYNEHFAATASVAFPAVVLDPAPETDCLICRQPMTIGVSIPCQHNFFHPHCLSIYWDTCPQCPICRSVIPDDLNEALDDDQ